MNDLRVANSKLDWKVCESIVNCFLEELRIQGGSTTDTGGIWRAASLFDNGGDDDGVTSNSENSERSI